MTPGTTITLTTGEVVIVARVYPMRRLLLTTAGTYASLRLVPGYAQIEPASARLAGADLTRPARAIARERRVSTRTVLDARRAAGIVVTNQGRPRAKGTLWPPVHIPGTSVLVADVNEAWNDVRNQPRPIRTVAQRFGLPEETVREWVRG